MKKELWAYVYVSVHPMLSSKDENGSYRTNHYHSHEIRGWRYPKWIIDKHRWFFRWVQALVQARFPKHRVSFHYCGYYPETREAMQSKRQRAISSAKSQVTRYENKINLLKEHCAGTLFQDYTQHPVYPKLKSKLEENKFKLNQAIMAEIEETV